jgi:5-methylcytosine-specific restriction enzyme subunit McrC
MATYLGRFQSPAGMVTWGLLAYPFDPSKPGTPNAEQSSPWSLDDRKKIVFATLPHNPADAVAKLRSLVMQVATPAAWSARA